MDYYPVYIYDLYEGNFYKIGEGIWGGLDWEDGPEINEEGEPDYQFEWEGKRCSEERFYAEIDKIFPLEEGIRPLEWYTKNEMLELVEEWKYSTLLSFYMIKLKKPKSVVIYR